jgi:hypothetical protein
MDTGFVLFKAMKKVALEYNPTDINEWGDRKTYGQMANDLSEQLKDMGYTIEKIKSEVITDNNG